VPATFYSFLYLLRRRKRRRRLGQP